MLTPKNYQNEAVDALTEFFRRSKARGSPAAAFTEITGERFGVGLPYFTAPGFTSDEFKGMPYVCLRLPTGGGKTLLATLCVPVIQRELLQQDRSVVLWLVPSRTILTQTLSALRNRSHPYRQALETQLGSVDVLSMDEALSVTQATLDGGTVVLVGTMAGSRVRETEERKIYESSGTLHHHFAGLDAETLENLERNEQGVVPYSLANVLRLRRPIVIVDEAHNARTSLSFEVLARFRPSCILELTATPAREDSPSNVLFHVSAKQLAAEDMIKLPIRLATGPEWQRLLTDAATLREQLERDAKVEAVRPEDAIRPILLIKAERREKGRATLTVDEVEKVLLEAHIPPEQIVRATGDERGLDEIDLFDPQCAIRFVITVEALKEGWDCSWAYVLCSVAEMRSDTAIEQLIGRVLRLPGAKRKATPSLNRAYVFATSTSFAETARKLEDALVEGNGFNPLEAKDLVVASASVQGSLELSVGRIQSPKVLALGAVPETVAWSPALKAKVQVNAESGTVTLVAPLSASEAQEAASAFLMDSHREAFVAAAREYAKSAEQIFTTAAERGVQLAVPVLAVERQGILEWVEDTHFLERPWSLRNDRASAVGIRLPAREGAGGFGEVALNEHGRVRWQFGAALARELQLIEATDNWTEVRLIDWIDRNISHPDLPAEETTLFIATAIDALQQAPGGTLGQLVRDRFALRDQLEAQIAACRRRAKAAAFQDVMFGESLGAIRVSVDRVFAFDPDRYPARWMCGRSDDFRKHYHRHVGELAEKGEEFECALFLDGLAEIETWVRNLERQPLLSFWLPTATDRFYPDFVCKLQDGRILVVEYKGSDRWSTDDSKEKRRIGELWMLRSQGRCLFVMPNGKDFSAIEALVQRQQP